MTKLEFLGELERNLKGLGRNEIDDIISEYSSHIDSKVAEGFSEEQAVESFGNLEDLIEDIKSAYNVDPDFKYKSFKNYVAYYVGVFTEFVSETAACFFSMNRRETLLFIFRLMVLAAVLLFFRWPVEFAASSFSNIFSPLPMPIYHSVRALIWFCVDFIYIVVCAYVGYLYIRQLMRPIMEARPKKPPEAHYSSGEQSYRQSSPFAAPPFIFSESTENKSKYGRFSQHGAANRTPWASTDKASKAFSTVVTIVLGCVLMVIGLPLLALAAGLLVAFGVTAVLALMGYPFIGICVVLLGSILCSFSFLGGIIAMCFKRSDK